MVLPASAMISVLAEPIVLLLFGEQWTGAVNAFRILAFLIPLFLVQRISLIMGNSLGRPGFGLMAHALALFISLVGSAVGVRYGPEGVALAVLLAVGGSSLVAFRLVSIEVGLPFPPLAPSVVKGGALAVSVFISCVVLERVLSEWLGPLEALPQLAIVVPTMCAALLIVWFVGGKWLFSPPAHAFITDTRRKVVQRVGRRFRRTWPA
jgi:O-antigen/teichoic acid export membrane protein